MKKPSLKLIPNKPFVILSHPKSGGELLANYLNQFPNIRCYGQLFKKDKIQLPEKKIQRLKATVESRDQEPVLFLKQLLKLTPKAHTGFAFSYNQHLLLRRWLINSEAINRVIVLRNPFDLYVAQCSAVAVGAGAGQKDAAQEIRVLQKFDPEDFEKKIMRIIAGQARLKAIAEKRPELTMTITFDEIAVIESVRRLADFLGASSQPEVLKVDMNKRPARRYTDIFEDFQQVQSYVSKHHPELVIDAAKI